MEQISVTELAALGTPAAILDVREPDEVAALAVPGTARIPMGEVLARLDELPDAEPLYVLCRSGGRSARVASALEQSGIAAVNVDGGILAWRDAGLPVEGSDAPAS